MNILVTGGAGYIGSHTCKKLFKAGYTPVVLDDLSTGHKRLVKWGPFEEGDISDYENNIRIIKKYNIEAVIHFAAKAYVDESMLNPQNYFKNNVIGTQSLLNACNFAKVKNFIFSSTAAVYKDGLNKVNEQSKIKPGIKSFGHWEFSVDGSP